MNKSVNIQDMMLNEARKNKIEITVILMKGYQIKGRIKGFDNYVILLETDEKQQLIYKHAISTIIPSRCINFLKDDC